MLLENLLHEWPQVQVIESGGSYVPIDLSVGSAIIPSDDANAMQQQIENYLKDSDAAVAYGGYDEERALYKRSSIFNSENGEARSIHIGLDLWAKAGTPVLAALDGEVHSFNYNAGFGNYGPTIILRHELKGITFHTLYGHLSAESIEEIEIGDKFTSGDIIATLGDASVNGNYAPHLHFQIIKELGNYFGDYPGVCNKSDRDFFLSNCPDPNLLLKLN